MNPADMNATEFQAWLDSRAELSALEREAYADQAAWEAYHADMQTEEGYALHLESDVDDMAREYDDCPF